MREIAPPPVRNQSVRIEHHHSARCPVVLRDHWTPCGQTQDAAGNDEMHRFRTVEHAGLNIANACKCQRALAPVEACEPHHDTTSCTTGASHSEKNVG